MSRSIGRLVTTPLADLGGIVVLLGRALRALVPPRLDGPETWRSLYRVGVRSLPLVVLTALFAGAIMVVQTGHYVRQTGATGFVGWAASLAVLSELGPMLIGLMFSGRVGAHHAAELGSMTTTDQVDALRALAIDPVAYLVAPRVVAMVVMLFVLTVIGDLFALLGGAVTADLLLSIDLRVFFAGMLRGQLVPALLQGLLKAALFGMCIAVVSCHYGLSVRGGAPGVGRAVSRAVVVSAAGIFLIDYLVSRAMV